MDITAETIQKVLEISRPEIHKVQDVYGCETNYATKQLFQVKAAAPDQPDTVTINTLGGLADLIRIGLESSRFQEDWMIRIKSEVSVTVESKDCDTYGRRSRLIVCSPVEFTKFRFGQWMGQEEFVIAVASLFADGYDKNYVLGIASALTMDATSLSEDDGFSQKATTKAGMRMKAETTLKPRVELAPYRTFPEIEQPVSEFVFRAKCDGDSRPMLMLIEADGGRWKVDAMAKICRALHAFDLGVPTIS